MLAVPSRNGWAPPNRVADILDLNALWTGEETTKYNRQVERRGIHLTKARGALDHRLTPPPAEDGLANEFLQIED
jgi:hypothetical protein